MRRNTGENVEQPGSQHGQGPPQGQPPHQGQRPPQQPPQQGGQPRQGSPQQSPPQGQPPQQGGRPPAQQGQRSQRGGSHQGGPASDPHLSQGQPQQGQMGQQPPGQRPPGMQQQSQMQGQMGQQGRSSGGGMSPGMMSQRGTMGQPGGMGQQSGMGSQGMQQPGLGPHLQSVDIEDIIQTDVVTAEPDTPIQTVAAKMEEEDVGAVVVVDDDEPIGVVTDRKIALLLQETEDISNQSVQDVMTEDLVTGTTMMTVFDVLDRLSKEDIRRLPIVDEDGSLEGIVTLDDLIVLLGTELQKATDIVKSQSPRL